MKTKEYYDKFIKKESEGICVVCGKETKYADAGVGYRITCGHKCGCINTRKLLKETPEKFNQFIEKVKINQSNIWKQRDKLDPIKIKISETLRLTNMKLTSQERAEKFSRYYKCDDETIKKLNRVGRKQCYKNWRNGVSGFRHCLKGKYTPKNPQKYKGDINNIIFRSSYEKRVLEYLDNHPDVIEFSSEEVVIPYISPVDLLPHKYFVDFRVRVKTKDGKIKTYLLEVKPKAQTIEPKRPKRQTKKYLNEVMTWGVNQAKWKSAEEYCADRGWEFLKITEDDIFGKWKLK